VQWWAQPTLQKPIIPLTPHLEKGEVKNEIAYLAPSLGLDPSGLFAYAQSSIFAIPAKIIVAKKPLLAMTHFSPLPFLSHKEERYFSIPSFPCPVFSIISA